MLEQLKVVSVARVAHLFEGCRDAFRQSIMFSMNECYEWKMAKCMEIGKWQNAWKWWKNCNDTNLKC